MAATRLPPFDRAPLARFLAAAAAADRAEIAAVELLTGGAIQENWGFEARFVGGKFAGTHRLVLRTDAATGVPSSLRRIQEFAVLRAVHAAGVTVPEPLWVCADPDAIGRPFFVMRRVAGTAQGREITADPALEAELPRIAARLGRELALIQTIRPPRADLAFLPTIGAAEHIAGFRAYLDMHRQARPVLEWAIRWLETHVPESMPPVLCHRDFRTGNYMLAPTLPSPASGGGEGRGLDRPELTAVLDWEFAGWGDPDEDIGWMCCKGWRFARLDRDLGGIAERAPFYDAYAAASGRQPDPARVFFWEVLANVRWAVIALQQSDRHLIGGARDLSTAIIGRRATECDLELLMLLDADGVLVTSPSPPSGERVGPAVQRRVPSPSRRIALGPALSRGAGEGQAVRDLPSGASLLGLGRELLLESILPLLPSERHRDLRLVATAMAMAEREAAAADAPARDIAAMLGDFYAAEDSAAADPHPDPPPLAGEGVTGGPSPPYGSPPPQAGEGGVGASPPARSLTALLRRFAADLRTGTFEACGERGRAARAILWRLTMLKLREGNPGFLAANGFGE